MAHAHTGQHNDARMNMALVMTAVKHGATVANKIEVLKIGSLSFSFFSFPFIHSLTTDVPIPSCIFTLFLTPTFPPCVSRTLNFPKCPSGYLSLPFSLLLSVDRVRM